MAKQKPAGKKRRPVRTGRPKTRVGVCESPECQEFALLLTEYWENRDDATLRQEIEEHARACPGCAEVLQGYSVTVARFRSASQVSLPGGAHRQLWERLARQLSAFKEYLR